MRAQKMSDINSCTFTGRLTSDATYRTLASGKSVLNCNIAVNTGYGDYKKTIFIKVQQWCKAAQNLVTYLKKGTLIGCNGELSRSEWSDKENNIHVEFVLDTYNIQLLSSKNSDISDDKCEAVEDTAEHDTDLLF
jgi:single-strand DNA-binding protein